MKLSVVMLAHLRKAARGNGTVYITYDREYDALYRRGLVEKCPRGLYCSSACKITEEGRRQVEQHETKMENGHYVGCDWSLWGWVYYSSFGYCYRCGAPIPPAQVAGKKRHAGTEAFAEASR